MSEKDNEQRGTTDPATFYGINLRLADGLNRPEGVPMFCTTIQEVQAVMKAYKGARFKPFPSQAEAETFSRQAVDAAEAPVPTSGEKPSPYKNPSRPEFQTFRSLVERGDVAAVSEAVSRNPRYLVSSCDTPALLREGPRHNALHLAALHGRGAVCRRLLRLVAEPDLFRRLYPDDEPQVAATRAEYMVDLYLNMPTKGTFETPLHLAAKLGHVEVVRELVQHPACRRDVRNKFGETPEQVICKQCTVPDPASAGRQLRFLLQEPFFVQVLADADGCSPPVLAPPCSPQQQKTSPQSQAQSPSPESPLSSPLQPRAWAGPMPRELADELHRRWRSPLSVSPLRSRPAAGADDVRLTDAGKGWERVGRTLASEMSVEWHEYWPFLGRALDIRSEEGLLALEDHLHRESCKLLDPTSVLEEVARRLEPAPAPGPAPAAAARRSPRGSSLSPVSALCRDLHELRLDDGPADEAGPRPAPCRRRLHELLRRRQYSEPLPADLDSDASDAEEFYTPPSSLESCSPATPGEAPEVFIHGRQPTTADLDVLRALESVTVDPARFPSVVNWRSQVLTRSRSQGFRRRPAEPRPQAAVAPPPAVARSTPSLPSPWRRVRCSPVLALIGPEVARSARPFVTPRRPSSRPPAVPPGDGSPVARPSAGRLTRHIRPVNGPL